MWARKLKIRFDGVEVGTTPMLIPSISSRINIDINSIISTSTAVIDGPLLVSAYDLFYLDKIPDLSFPSIIFLDSGGYECRVDKDLSELGLYKPIPQDWTRDKHISVIKKWCCDKPTVIISYDHPNEPDTIKNQIENAKCLFHGRDDILKEILIKPDPGNRFIKHDQLVESINSFDAFDIIGFTEKELGSSILDRMVAIANIRNELDKRKIEKPIHIFGSLDTITTPLYYFSGADIFDGLSWLRFIYDKGKTLYIDSYGPMKYGVHETSKRIWASNLYLNYNYLRRLQLDLEQFQSDNKFDRFGENSEFFAKAYRDLIDKVGGGL